MNTDIVIPQDERAVETGQIGQAAQTDFAQANVGFFEPQTVGDLARQGRLYLVADGLNGAASGQAASRFAIQQVIHSFYTSKTTDPKTRLIEAVQQANAAIFERNAQNPARRPLATTLIAALIHNNKLIVANVGDNRVYVVWDQDIEWLNQGDPKEENDDSPVLLITPKVEESSQDADSPAPTSFKNRQPDALGLSKEAEIKVYTRRLFVNDIVVLCSGGLTGYLQDNEIARAVNTYPPEPAIKRIMALASERGYYDRSAVSIIRLLTTPVAAKPPKPAPVPPVPTWSDFEKPSRPVPVDGKPKTVTETKPMSKPAPKPQFMPKPVPIRRDSGRNWKAIVVGLAILVLACVIGGALAWTFWPAGDMSEGDEIAAEATPVMAEIETESGQVIKVPATPTDTPTITPTPGPATATQSTSSVVTPTPAGAVNTPASAASDRVSPIATPTPTATLPPLPTIQLPAGCESRGRFVRDATIPDGTELAAGESFEKVWLVQNAGDCPWGPGFTVQFLEGESMSAANVVAVREVTEPNEPGEVKVQLVAPTRPGSYEATWQLHDLDGQPFGPELYLEIEVVAPTLSQADPAQTNSLYDFIANADQARWSSGSAIYSVSRTDVTENLPVPSPQGLVVVGLTQLRGNVVSDGEVLLTYPDQETGYIEGVYVIDTPLQPTDTFAAELGFPKLSILSDDGVTFEAAFTPAGSDEEILIFSTPVQYADSPVTELSPLADVPAGATGTITLRVLSGESLNRDWAIWINARLVRP